MATEEWGHIELMGYRTHYGRVTEVQKYGVPLIKVEIPDGDNFQERYYSPQALYALTPMTEAAVRARCTPVPPLIVTEHPQLTEGDADHDLIDEDPDPDDELDPDAPYRTTEGP
jgi:hypothetical protein